MRDSIVLTVHALSTSNDCILTLLIDLDVDERTQNVNCKLKFLSERYGYIPILKQDDIAIV